MSLTARAIVLDREYEYELPGAVYAYSLAEAIAQFCKLRWQPFHLVVRLRDPMEYCDLLEVVMYAQDTEPHGPIVVVGEEFSTYSETQEIEPVFREAYNAGRALRLSLLTVIQLDTDIHRVTRANSRVVVSMAQMRLSTDMARLFNWREVERLVSLDEPGQWTAIPEQGTHFVCAPNIDLYDSWAELQGVIYRPVRQTAIAEPEPAQQVSR